MGLGSVPVGTIASRMTRIAKPIATTHDSDRPMMSSVCRVFPGPVTSVPGRPSAPSPGMTAR